MLRCHRVELQLQTVAQTVARPRPVTQRLLPLAALTLAAALAGCATDVSRLERPGLAEAGPIPSQPIGRRNAGAPPPYENSGWGGSGPRAGTAAAPQGSNDRVAALPESSAPVNPSHPFDAPRRAKATAAPAAHNTIPVVPGATIEVQPGDTLSGLSSRHKVSIGALMDLNGLKSASLKPGQIIRLPANARRPVAKSEVETPVAAAVGQPPAVRTPVAAAPAAEGEGSYVVKPGDSLYGIARAHKTTTAHLQQLNGITDATKLKPGQSLKISGAAGAPAQAAEAPPVPVMPAAQAGPAANSGGVRLLNPPPATVTAGDAKMAPVAKVAGLGPVAVPTATPAAAAVTPIAAPAAAAGSVKFRWPARGTTLAAFGKRPDGVHNDGINIAVAAGTDIAAADAGTVAYAGSEIRVYGNLILIRHEGGWVTAYAHADSLLVKRGDTVKRGQIIAKAGATGSVDQPQVHFELRQGSKPIDPQPYMEK